MVRYYERLPNAPADDRNLPDLLFNIYDTMVIFDHVYKTVLVVAHADLTDAGTQAELRKAYDSAIAKIDELIQIISRPLSLLPVQIGLPMEPVSRWESSIPRGDYEKMVEACKEYIRAGDIFQVVPSQRLSLETPARPFDIYRALRVINPSPFMFQLKFPEVVLVGASRKSCAAVKVASSPIAPWPERAAVVRLRPRIASCVMNCSPIPRSEPSTSCWSTWAVTTSAGFVIHRRSSSAM
jgi:anthranilate synthase component 1